MSLWTDLLNPGVLVEKGKGKIKEKKQDGFIVGCFSCPMEGQSTFKFLTSDPVPTHEFWFEAPERADEISKRPAGETYSVYKDLYASLGIDFDKLSLNYAIKCKPTTGGRNALFSHCSGHSRNISKLAAQRRNGNPAVIVFENRNVALQHSEGTFKNDQNVFWREDLQATCYILPHPSDPLFARMLQVSAWHMQNPGRYSYLWTLDVRHIFTAEQLKATLEYLKASGFSVTMDIEDDGRGRLLCVGFCIDGKTAYVLAMDHPENTYWENEKDAIIPMLQEFLADETIQKTFQYGTYDGVEFEDRYGWPLKGYTWDTLYGSYLNDSWIRKHGLEGQVQRHLPEFAGYKTIVEQYYSKSEDEESGSIDRGHQGLARCPLRTLMQYNGGDNIVTNQLEKGQRATEAVSIPMMDTYIKAGYTLRRMELYNMPYLDKEHQAVVYRVASERLRTLVEEIRTFTGDPAFNPGSNVAVKEVLYEQIKFPRPMDSYGEETEESNASTLRDLAYHYPDCAQFPNLILEYRKFEKYEQYSKKMLESAINNDGKVVTRYMLAGAATGRLRSSGAKSKADDTTLSMNLQNMTKGSFVKNCIVADPGWKVFLHWSKPIIDIMKTFPDPAIDAKGFAAAVEAHQEVFLAYFSDIPGYVLDTKLFVIADYAALEFYVAAALAKCKPIIEAIGKKMDLHGNTGKMMGLGEPKEIKKNKTLRTLIKIINFSLIYGSTVKGLFYRLREVKRDITMEETADLHERFFKAYPEFVTRNQSVVQSALQNKFVKTMWGFVRKITKQVIPNSSLENAAVNTVVQSPAHHYMLMTFAMIAGFSHMFQYLNPKRGRGLSLEVHDALYSIQTVRDLFPAAEELRDTMINKSRDYGIQFFNTYLGVELNTDPSFGFTMGTEVELSELKEQTLPHALMAWLVRYYETECNDSKTFGYSNRLI